MRFVVLPFFDGVIMDGHFIGCPSAMTPSKMGKTNLIFYSLIFVSNENFLGRDYGARYIMRAVIQINVDPKWTCQVQIASTQ